MNIKRPDHTDILDFLEDNISKLVKLKVASCAKYKEYYEAMSKYLTAESIEDSERTMMYETDLERCRIWLQHKLMKAVLEDKSLLDNKLVAEYQNLMFPDLQNVQIPDDEDTRYTDLFKGSPDETFELVDVLLCYSPGTLEEEEDRMEELTEAELLEMLDKQFYEKVSVWIDDLPHNDLKLLRELVRKGGRMKAPATALQLLVEQLDIVDRSLGSRDIDPEFILYPNISAALAPYLDDAIKKKEENDEGFLECLFMGILSTTGMVEESDAKEAMKQLVRQAERNLTDKDVERFFDHSMLVRFHRGGYVCSPGGHLWSRLSYATWEEEIRDELDTCIPSNFLDVIAHGQYPYFMPHRREERTFYDLIHKQRSDEDSLSILTYYYVKLQDPEYGVKEMMQEFSEDYTFRSMNDANKALSILTDFSNGIPKFILKGHSSKEIMSRDTAQMPPFLDRATSFGNYASRTPYVNPVKVGRNEPCPCGSGKKYKNCCGR